jgi:hypothetical protein
MDFVALATPNPETYVIGVVRATAPHEFATLPPKKQLWHGIGMVKGLCEYFGQCGQETGISKTRPNNLVIVRRRGDLAAFPQAFSVAFGALGAGGFIGFWWSIEHGTNLRRSIDLGSGGDRSDTTSTRHQATRCWSRSASAVMISQRSPDKRRTVKHP